MCIVGKDRLLELIKKYKVIDPHDENHLDGDGYVLTVEKTTALQYLEHKNLVSHEMVFTPPNYVAYLTAKSKFGRMGLSFLNAAKVHSGFVGRLALELVNLNNDRTSITIAAGDPLMHIEFITRDGVPSPYIGEYQFQFMMADEIRAYVPILKRTFSNFDELARLWRMEEKISEASNTDR